MANIRNVEVDIEIEIDDFLCECSEKEIEEIIEWLKRMDKI